MQHVWLMIAFAPAPGFRPAKNGKSWFAHFATREQAIKAKYRLVALGIRYICKKTEARQPYRQNVIAFKPRKRALRGDDKPVMDNTRFHESSAGYRARRPG